MNAIAIALSVVACGGGQVGVVLEPVHVEPVEEGPPPPPHETLDDGGGWSLDERAYWTKLQEELDEFAKKTNAHCHSQITASYVKDTWRGQLTDGGNYGLPQYKRTVCTAALSTILELCGNGDQHKRAVASKIRHVTCAFGPTRYELRGDGVFDATFDAADENVSTYHRAVREVLGRSL